MRRLPLLLVVAGVMMCLFQALCEAQEPACEAVYGYAYKGANVLANYPIQAMYTLGFGWEDVATTDGNGHYFWNPDGNWPNTTIYMRVKPRCEESTQYADPTDTPSWVHTQDSICDSIQVDVHGNCP